VTQAAAPFVPPVGLFECLPPDPLRALDTHMTPLGEAWSFHPGRTAGLSKALQAAWWEAVLERAAARCLAVQEVTLLLPDGARRVAFVVRGIDQRRVEAFARGEVAKPAARVWGLELPAWELANLRPVTEAELKAAAELEAPGMGSDDEIPF
jgi:hypothetical protein